MLRVLWSCIRELLIGPLDRATRLDLDCRHTLPGWPAGLSRDQGETAVSQALRAELRARAQQALPDLWGMPPVAQLPTSRCWQVIEGGRHAPSQGRRHFGDDMHTR